jgi:hypothetical protein
MVLARALRGADARNWKRGRGRGGLINWGRGLVRLATHIPSGDLTAERVLHVEIFCLSNIPFFYARAKTMHVVSSSYPLESFLFSISQAFTPLFFLNDKLLFLYLLQYDQTCRVTYWANPMSFSEARLRSRCAGTYQKKTIERGGFRHLVVNIVR